MKAGRHFVGREAEKEFFNKMLQNPEGQKRICILLVLGIGKTELITQVLLEEIRTGGDVVLIPQETNGEGPVPILIDLYATENCTIDGIQSTIIRSLGSQYQHYFKAFLQLRQDTSAVFRQCMQKLCEEKTIVLSFDTFELVHDDVVAGWILRSGPRDLQMPNLISLIGSRKPISSISRINALLDEPKISSIVELVKVQGFSETDALDLYAKLNGIELCAIEPYLEYMIAALVEKTEGNPLSIELAYEFLSLERHQPESLNDKVEERWRGDHINKLSKDEFEAELMQTLQNFGRSRVLSVQYQALSEAAYNTIVCLSYLTRRFDQHILKAMIEQGFILSEFEDAHDIIDALRDLFFVKIYENGDLQLQLHDEMARLTRKYLWVSHDFRLMNEIALKGGQRDNFMKWVPELYNQLILEEIEKSSFLDEVEKALLCEKIAQLKAEKLYYILEWDLTEGLHFFSDLLEESNSLLNNLLPGK